MPQLFWTKRATQELFENLQFVLENWTEKEAKAFNKELNRILKIIVSNPKCFQRTNISHVHVVPIIPKVSLFYRLEKNGDITILCLWNNQLNPNSRKL
jgi:plasmid stabilization system protein ParE